MRVLVTGATGYIGGRLVSRLVDLGVKIRCMTRDPTRIQLLPWVDNVEVAAADVGDSSAVEAALEGCDMAYYLIHSMGSSGRDHTAEDRLGASNFCSAAERTALSRIVYLGALGDSDDELSPHLQSRQEVGRILASGSTPVTEFRAAVIIGSGSVSFEMIRHLTELLPVMFRPKWVRTRCQPIAVRNVLEILVSALNDLGPESHVYDIGGPDVLTYEEMMQEYARVAGLARRVVVPLPLFNTNLAPGVIGLITPLAAQSVRPLVKSLLNDVVVSGESPPGFDPSRLITYRQSVRLAMARISEGNVETRWSDAVTQPELPLPGDPHWAGAVMEAHEQVVASAASADDLFWAVKRIGGDVGYYSMNWAWQIRGWVDSVIGGVGLRRGRRHPEHLRVGEAVDFFRVAEVDPQGRRLTLRAEMKVPGTAWLEWSIEEASEGSMLVQRARFVPRGLLGRLYWWLLLPVHAPIFRRMALGIAAAAEHR